MRQTSKVSSVRSRFTGALATGLCLLVFGSAFGEEFHQGVGRVVTLNPTGGTVVLDHEEITGFMPRMIMRFPVASPEVLKDLRPGDQVRFTLKAEGPMGVITEIAKDDSERVAVMAPDFALPDLTGRTISFSELKGKPVLLHFWATWCHPCRTEMPSLERAYQDYRAAGLVIVAINVDQGPQAQVETFVKDSSVTFPVLVDPKWTAAEAYDVFGAVPTTYLINRAGQIVARVGGVDWTQPVARNALEALLR